MSTFVRRRGAVTAAAVVAALGLSALAASPAFADTGTWFVGEDSGATVAVADAVVAGNAIHLEGTGWTDGKADSDANGSWIGVKLGAAGGLEPDPLTVEPLAGKFTFPGAASGSAAIWSGIVADDDGGFSVDIPFPTPSNTNPALSAAWAPGSTHHLQLLTGSMKPGGDKPRSVALTFTISADTLSATAASGGRGVPAGTVTITVAGGDGRFAPNEVLSAKVDGVDAAWSSGGTASATGALTGAKLTFTPGTLRAGDHTVEITGATSGTATKTVTVLPTAAFSALSQGADGTLTLSNLPTGSSVAAVSFDGLSVPFSGLPAAASADGVATVSYAIPADAILGTYPVTVTLSNPAATFALSGQKISPDSTVFGADLFTISSQGEGFFQGLYQSAYSSAEKALFVTAASGTGASEDGYLYKVDPATLSILKSAHPKELTANGETGKAPYGVGVDDVNGTVWVTNTRTATLAVYRASDLTLLKQFPANLIGHPRDVVYDPKTDRVFASSASEGSSGDGYISVFDAKTFEKIQDIQTGARSTFNPVSLSLDEGVLVSPSLSSNRVAVIDTQALTFRLLEISGIQVGGRGASGIAIDAASHRLYIAGQNSDEVVIADSVTGETIKEVATGAGALNVVFDKVNKLVYVANFGGTTVTVMNADGTKVANLPIARANHVTLDGAGNVYAVDKNSGNKVWKISLNEKPGTEEPGTEEPGTEEPGTDQPGTDQPGTDQPGTGGHPGTDQPSKGGDGSQPAKNAAGGSSLAQTGSDFDGWLAGGIALLLLVGGAVTVLFSRRQAQQR